MQMIFREALYANKLWWEVPHNGARLRACYCCLVAQLCPTLLDPMDCSPPGSSVHGISQTRALEWVVISLSTGSS